jgi:hypothetical protein
LNRTPLNTLARIIKTKVEKAKENRGDHKRDFKVYETETGQQVAQILFS